MYEKSYRLKKKIFAYLKTKLLFAKQNCPKSYVTHVTAKFKQIIRNLKHLFEHLLVEIRNYFETFKFLKELLN